METFSFGTPPGCRETQVFDISELENEGDFELDGVGVMTVTAGGLFEEICVLSPTLVRARSLPRLLRMTSSVLMLWVSRCSPWTPRTMRLVLSAGCCRGPLGFDGESRAGQNRPRGAGGGDR